MAVLAHEAQVATPDKLFYRINEVSKITGLKPYVLRYWETEFPQLSPEKDDNDQRRYRRKDIDLIQRIKQLLYEEKFTIAGAKQRIASESAAERKSATSSRRAAATVVDAPVETPAPVRVSRPSPAPRRPAPAKTSTSDGFLAELASIRKEIEGLIAMLQA